MDIRTFEYEEGDIKVAVPFDGETFINATEAYQAFGKSSSNFTKFRQRHLEPYAERLIELGKIPNFQNGTSADLLVVRRGGEPGEQGTWLHPKLAIMFARWLSMDFEIWCDDKIEYLLQEGYVGIDDDTTDMLKPFNDLIKKSVKANKFNSKTFGPCVIELLGAMEKVGASYKAYKAAISALSKTHRADKLDTYKKTSKAVEEAYETGVISRRTWEDLTSIVHSREVQVLKHRKTRIENQNTKLQEEIDQLKADMADTQTSGGDTTELEEKVEKLEKKLALYVAAEKNPPIKIEYTDGTLAPVLISKFRDSIKKTEGVVEIFADFATQNPKGGDKSKNGQSTKPHWFAENMGRDGMFSCAMWDNPHSIGFRYDKIKTKLFNTSLEKSHEHENIYTGFYAINAGIRVYIWFDAATELLLMYGHSVKYDSNN